jgi:hypothetical protein
VPILYFIPFSVIGLTNSSQIKRENFCLFQGRNLIWAANKQDYKYGATSSFIPETDVFS